MATWFIRVKHNYELAEKGIVMIGFGIHIDITHMGNQEEIENYLVNERGEKRGRSSNTRARLINTFINKVKEGDTIISPFDGGYLRIGEITSKCEAVKSILNDEQKLVNAFGEQGKEIEGNKPAREVKWITEKLHKNELPYVLRETLNKTMRMTIHSLDIGDIADSSISTDLEKTAINKFIDIKKTIDTKEVQTQLSQLQNLLDEMVVEREEKANKDWIFKTAVTTAITAVSTALATAFTTSFIIAMDSHFTILFAFVFFTLILFVIYIAYLKEYGSRFSHALEKFKDGFSNYKPDDLDDGEAK